MATIALEVPDELAQRYRQVPDTERKRLDFILSIHLRAAFETTREASIDRLEESMKRLGEQATANGLTEAILQEILNERKAS